MSVVIAREMYNNVLRKHEELCGLGKLHMDDEEHYVCCGASYRGMGFEKILSELESVYGGGDDDEMKRLMNELESDLKFMEDGIELARADVDAKVKVDKVDKVDKETAKAAKLAEKEAAKAVKLAEKEAAKEAAKKNKKTKKYKKK